MSTTARPRRQPHAPASAAANLPDPAVLTAKGLAAFFRITESWGLSAAQQQVVLGDPARSTFFKWKAGDAAAVGRDTLERLSYVVGIYKALQILIPQRELADAWIKNPNDAPLFGGQPPLALLLEGSVASLYRVRAFLDAQRGGWG